MSTDPTIYPLILPDSARPSWAGVRASTQQHVRIRTPWLIGFKSKWVTNFYALATPRGPLTFQRWVRPRRERLDSERLYLDHIIVVGETGPKAKPLHPDWVRKIRDQCQRAGVLFQFLGWGDWIPVVRSADDRELVAANGDVYSFSEGPRPESLDHNDEWRQMTGPFWGLFRRVGHERSGRILDGREWDETPENRDETMFLCTDCGVDVSAIQEYYMLHNRVWAAATRIRPAVMLCVGCVETRLARQLTSSDFRDCPLNHRTRQSDRLRHRLRAQRTAAFSRGDR